MERNKPDACVLPDGLICILPVSPLPLIVTDQDLLRFPRIHVQGTLLPAQPGQHHGSVQKSSHIRSARQIVCMDSFRDLNMDGVLLPDSLDLCKTALLRPKIHGLPIHKENRRSLHPPGHSDPDGEFCFPLCPYFKVKYQLVRMEELPCRGIGDLLPSGGITG